MNEPPLLTLPGCGMPASFRFELFSQGNKSLDGDVWLCAEHAAINTLRDTTGLWPYRADNPANGERCGAGWDFQRQRAIEAPPAPRPVTNADLYAASLRGAAARVPGAYAAAIGLIQGFMDLRRTDTYTDAQVVAELSEVLAALATIDDQSPAQGGRDTNR